MTDITDKHSSQQRFDCMNMNTSWARLDLLFITFRYVSCLILSHFIFLLLFDALVFLSSVTF